MNNLPPMHKVKVTARIRRNSDGVVRDYHTTEFVSDDETIPNGWSWSNGNYSCDCNRSLFFERVGGVELIDVVCSEGRYSVCVLEDSTGMVGFSDFDES